MSFIDVFLQKPLICSQCQKKFKPIFHNFYIQGQKGLAIYFYDETIRQYLYQLKGAFDVEISSIFLQPFARFLHYRYRKFLLLPAPSTEASNQQRGFNHVINIFSCLNLPILPIFLKTAEVKQAGLNYYQRQEIGQHLKIISPEKIRNKNVLIVDDVKTTGATIRAMIDLAKAHHAKKISVLVLAETKVNSNKTLNVYD